MNIESLLYLWRIFIRQCVKRHTKSTVGSHSYTHTIHTVEYNNNRWERKQIIEMRKRQLELSKHTAYDAYKHIHIFNKSKWRQHSRLRPRPRRRREKHWIESNRKTKRFNFICLVCSSVSIVLLRGKHTTRDRRLCVFFSLFLVKSHSSPNKTTTATPKKREIEMCVSVCTSLFHPWFCVQMKLLLPEIENTTQTKANVIQKENNERNSLIGY